MRTFPRLLFVVLPALLLGALAGCFGPVYDAARDGNTQQVRKLLARGYKDDTGLAFLQASCQGKWEMAQMLLENGANASFVSHELTVMYLTSALQCAAMNGHAPVVALLLEHGADREYKGNGRTNGLTALEIAKKNGHTEVVKILEDAPTQATLPSNALAPSPSAASSPPPIY